jgi:hypothetical protein
MMSRGDVGKCEEETTEKIFSSIEDSESTRKEEDYVPWINFRGENERR